MLNITQKILKFLEVKNEFLFVGEPGCGKTYAAEEIAKEIGAEVIFQQVTSGTRIDSLREEAVPSEGKVSGIEIMPGALTRALLSSKKKKFSFKKIFKKHKRKVVLILDEWDKTPSSMDAVLLDFLQNCRIVFKQKEIVGNKKNLVVILTANCGRELTEPLMRRVVKINFPPMESEFVEHVLKGKFNNKELVGFLVKLYKIGLERDLRKKATLQELQELGEIVEISGGLEALNIEEILDLLEKFVFKYDEDMEEVKEALPLILVNGEAVCLNGTREEENMGFLSEIKYKKGLNVAIEATDYTCKKILLALKSEYEMRHIVKEGRIVGIVTKDSDCNCKVAYLVNDLNKYGVVMTLQEINVTKLERLLSPCGDYSVSFKNEEIYAFKTIKPCNYKSHGISSDGKTLTFNNVSENDLKHYVGVLEVSTWGDWEVKK